MQRTITVKGVGNISVKPNYVILSMSINSMDKNYNKAMNLSAHNINALTDTLVSSGFDKEDIETTDFDVDTDYTRVEDSNGNYHSELLGYVVSYEIEVGFDFDTDKLSKVLFKISECISHPKVSIQFTVKNTDDVKDELLCRAAENARHKAEILCGAAGEELGQLISINYDWSEMNIYSRTELKMPSQMDWMEQESINIKPNDIKLRDTAAFVWEIK